MFFFFLLFTCPDSTPAYLFTIRFKHTAYVIVYNLMDQWVVYDIAAQFLSCNITDALE